VELSGLARNAASCIFVVDTRDQLVRKKDIPMRVQFAMWGNSLALRIPNAFAREISAAPGRSAEVTVHKGKLIVETIDEAPSYNLDELLAAMTPENLHGEISTGRAVGNEFA